MSEKIDELIAKAEDLGIQVDGRWKEERIEAAILEAEKDKETEEPVAAKKGIDPTRNYPISVYLKDKGYNATMNRLLMDLFSGQKSRTFNAWDIAVNDVINRRS